MRNKWKQILLVFGVLILSRLVVFGVGYLVTGKLQASDWTVWDGKWYYNIMTTGYDTTLPTDNAAALVCNQGTGYCQRDVAFFPLYPVLAKGLGDLGQLDYRVAAMIISNLCFIVAGLLLFRLAKKLFKSQGAAWWSVLLFAFSPFGYVFSGVMTESLFVFLLILAYSLAYERKYVWAGLVGALLAATRNTGILFVLPLFLVWFEQENHLGWKNIWRKLWAQKKIILGLLLVPLGLIAFMVFLYYQVGDALAFIHIQAYWDKPVLGLNPLFAFFYSFIDRSIEGSTLIHIMDLSIVFGLFGVFAYSMRTKTLKMSLNNILLWIMVPMLAGTLLAMGRYAAVAFPLYLVLGHFASKHKYLGICLLFIFMILLSLLTKLYMSGAWITV